MPAQNAHLQSLRGVVLLPPGHLPGRKVPRQRRKHARGVGRGPRRARRLQRAQQQGERARHAALGAACLWGRLGLLCAWFLVRGPACWCNPLHGHGGSRHGFWVLKGGVGAVSVPPASPSHLQTRPGRQQPARRALPPRASRPTPLDGGFSTGRRRAAPGRCGREAATRTPRCPPASRAPLASLPGPVKPLGILVRGQHLTYSKTTARATAICPLPDLASAVEKARVAQVPQSRHWGWVRHWRRRPPSAQPAATAAADVRSRFGTATRPHSTIFYKLFVCAHTKQAGSPRTPSELTRQKNTTQARLARGAWARPCKPTRAAGPARARAASAPPRPCAPGAPAATPRSTRGASAACPCRRSPPPSAPPAPCPRCAPA